MTTTLAPEVTTAPLLPADITPLEGKPGALQRSRVVREIMKLFYLNYVNSRMKVPTPRDYPQYRTNEKAWRVLLVGNGPTHGWGVATHGLSLTGQLGRALNRAVGQPVDVDYVGEELMNAATSVAWLKDSKISDYDMIVVVLSMNDAARLTPEEQWQSSVYDLLDHLRSQRRPGVGLMVVGIQPIKSIPEYNNPFGTLAQKHADRLNKIMNLSVLTAGDNFMFLPEPVIEAGRREGSPETYLNWAQDIAANAAPLMPKGEPGEVVYEAQKFEYATAERALGLDGVDRSAKFREIVAKAKRDMKLFVGYVSIMESKRQFFITGEGPLASSVPRELSYCDYTARQEDTLIVPNGNKDPRFKDNAYIEITHMPFYMGKSLKSREGEVVGTFCLMAPFPKSQKSVDVKKFETYAQQAQDALWELEAETDEQQPPQA